MFVTKPRVAVGASRRLNIVAVSSVKGDTVDVPFTFYFGEVLSAILSAPFAVTLAALCVPFFTAWVLVL